MLALYRAGRQADALRAYQRLRAVLGEELGLEPSQDIRALRGRHPGPRPGPQLGRPSRRAQGQGKWLAVRQRHVPFADVEGLAA